MPIAMPPIDLGNNIPMSDINYYLRAIIPGVQMKI